MLDWYIDCCNGLLSVLLILLVLHQAHNTIVQRVEMWFGMAPE